MSEQLDLEFVLQKLKQKHPSLQILLKKVEETSFYCRFAVQKIVQNMAQQKVKYNLTLINENQQLLTYSFNDHLDQAGFIELVTGKLAQLTHSPPLDYAPEIFSTRQSWQDESAGDFAPHSAQSFQDKLQHREIFQELAHHFDQSALCKWDNFAGLFSHRQKRTTLVSSKGGQLIHDQSYLQLEASAFTSQYEITAGQLVKSAKDFRWAWLHQMCARFHELPMQSFAGEVAPKVLLAPAALAQILDYLMYTDHFNAYSLNQQTSALAPFWKKSDQLFSSQFTLTDNPSPTRIGYTPFDGVGHIRKPVTLVKDGYFVQELTNEREAKNLQYAGHTESYREHGAYAYDLCLNPHSAAASAQNQNQNQEFDQLFAQLGDGYYLHDVHYLSLSDAQKLTLYGLTRGGFIEVKNGRPVAKLSNMRFEVSLFELFRQIEAFGASEEIAGFMGHVECPSMITRGLRFTQAATGL